MRLLITALWSALTFPAAVGAQSMPAQSMPAQARPAQARPTTYEARCHPLALSGRIRRFYRAERLLETHLLVETAQLFCPMAAHVGTWRYISALALLRLDEVERGREQLAELVTVAETRDRARIALAWSLLRAPGGRLSPRLLDGLPNRAGLRLAALTRLDHPPTFHAAVATLSSEDQRVAKLAHQRYLAARVQRRPWLAGVLSGIVPGLGQLYAGSWAGAATSFILNALFITATAELAHNELYLSAAVAGVAGSVFYIGGILNAADLARRRNDVASARPRAQLNRLLLPEVHAP